MRRYDKGHVTTLLSSINIDQAKKYLEEKHNVSLNEFDFSSQKDQARFLNIGILKNWNDCLFYTIVAMLYDNGIEKIIAKKTSKRKPDRAEIENRLMEIFNRVEVKPDIKKSATYIINLLK